MGVLEISGDLASAGAAFSGLLLVFLGFAVSGFENFELEERKRVQKRYRRRVRLAFTGLVLSVCTMAAGLVAKATNSEASAWLAAATLAGAALVVVYAAMIVALDLR